MTQDTEDISGVQALGAGMVQHRDDIDKRVSRLMVAASGRIIKAEAKRIALGHGFKRTGALIANIAVKRESKAPRGTTQYNVGVRHGRDLGRKAATYLAVNDAGRVVTRYENDPWYWVILEVGAKEHKIVAKNGGGVAFTKVPQPTTVRRSIAHPGMEGKPFLAPALENKRAEALAAMEDKLMQEIRKREGAQ